MAVAGATPEPNKECFLELMASEMIVMMTT